MKASLPIWILLLGAVVLSVTAGTVEEVDNACKEAECPLGPFCFGYSDLNAEKMCSDPVDSKACSNGFGKVELVEGNKYRFTLVGKGDTASAGWVEFGIDDPATETTAETKVRGFGCFIDPEDKSVSSVSSDGKTVGSIEGGSVSIEDGRVICAFEVGEDNSLIQEMKDVENKLNNFKIVYIGSTSSGTLEGNSIPAASYVTSSALGLTLDVFPDLGKNETSKEAADTKSKPEKPASTGRATNLAVGLILLISGLFLSSSVYYKIYSQSQQ